MSAKPPASATSPNAKLIARNDAEFRYDGRPVHNPSSILASVGEGTRYGGARKPVAKKAAAKKPAARKAAAKKPAARKAAAKKPVAKKPSTKKK